MIQIHQTYFLFFFFDLLMMQAALLTNENFVEKTICVEGIKASVIQNSSSDFEMLLEINSNKLLIAFQGTFDMIERFEIVAMKGFVELTTSFITTIKKLVGHLLCRID